MYVPSVAVAGGEAHEAVGQVVLEDESAQLVTEVGGVTHGAVPVTNDGLSNQSSEVVVIFPAHTLNSDGDVGGGHGVVTDANFGTDEVGLGLLLSGDGSSRSSGRSRGEAAKVLFGELDELIVGDTTASNENHAISGVVGLDVVNQLVALDALDVLLGSQDGTAESLPLESGGVKVIKNNLLGLLVNLLLLTEDHIPLAFDGGGFELGVLEDIGKDVDSLGNVGVEGLGVVDGVFSLLI